METQVLATDTPSKLAATVKAAAAALEKGEVVGLPTETVYGLAANALQAEAVAKIFEAKERPFFDPLIVHLPSRDWLERVVQVPPESRTLVETLIAKFWPGPLTLVLPRQSIVPDLVTSGLATVAVRMSAHPVFQAVVGSFGKPLAAPSANRFGRISPTTAEHVSSELGGRIPLIVDGGPTEHGVESTILKIEGTEMRLLRAGPVTPEDLCSVWQGLCAARDYRPSEAEVIGFYQRLGLSFEAVMHGRRDVGVEAPGQMESHYAPRTPMRLFPPGTQFRFTGQGANPARGGGWIFQRLPETGEQIHDFQMLGHEGDAPPRVGSLAFESPSTAGEFSCEAILSPTGDLREAAATLFAKMRRLDEAGLDYIFAEPVPERGLGIAIMDRLRKAAAQK